MSHTSFTKLQRYKAEALSLTMLVVGAIVFHYLEAPALWKLLWYILAVLPVTPAVVRGVIKSWHAHNLFNEYTLMLIASIGAFAAGEYPEAVAVLLFYSVGEKLEDDASDRARSRIRSLIDRMPSKVDIVDAAGRSATLAPDEVAPGATMIVKAGQRVALDGTLLGDKAEMFDTSAITGESVPRRVAPGGDVSSGYIPIDSEVRVKATKRYADSSMKRIMDMIEDAASRKSHTETLLTRITRWYTPTVMLLALLVLFVPWLVSVCDASYHFDFHMWFGRMLVLLVCACPCALVVSVPLSYFAAIGNASRMGVLFKGSRYIDAMRNIDTLMLDKTGTLTTGSFTVEKVIPAQGFTEADVLGYASAVDAHSTHPLATAIVAAAPKPVASASDVTTIDHGITGTVGGHKVALGSTTLMRKMDIDAPDVAGVATRVCVAVDGRYIGSILLADTIKPDVAATIASLHSLGIKNIVILSGDREEAVADVCRKVGADSYRARLLPLDKQRIVGEAIAAGHKVAFVGDGINDAPSLAAADVGIAIGTGGTDVAMESADAVITGNDLDHLVDVVKLSHKIKRVVTENVSVAIGVKLLVMVLGTFGLATLWAAVFADTGITLLTIIWTLIALRFTK